MPRTTTKPPKKVTASANTANAAPPVGDVMTLAEAAAYLRLPESEVARLVHEAGLPGRAVGEEWRFLKTALQDWLRGASDQTEQGSAAFAGRFMEGRPRSR